MAFRPWAVLPSFLALGWALVACDGAGPERETLSPEDRDPLLRECLKGLSHAVPFRFGEGNFADGDEVVISGIRGDQPDLRDGGTYCVWGRFKLASSEAASLGLQVGHSGGFYADNTRGPVREEVKRGEGRFARCFRLDKVSWMCLNFADAPQGTRHLPYRGIWFGNPDVKDPEFETFRVPR
jgi:hypothetical protein